MLREAAARVGVAPHGRATVRPRGLVHYPDADVRREDARGLPAAAARPRAVGI